MSIHLSARRNLLLNSALHLLESALDILDKADMPIAAVHVVTAIDAVREAIQRDADAQNDSSQLNEDG